MRWRFKAGAPLAARGSASLLTVILALALEQARAKAKKDWRVRAARSRRR